MPKVVVEINGRVVEQYERATNRTAFEFAWSLSKQYGASLEGRGYYEIYVVTDQVRKQRLGVILQIDETGDIVGEYVSSGEAGRITGIPSGNIRRALSGELKCVGGFYWKRA